MSILKTNFCVYYTPMGDKRIVHYLKLIALSVAISVNLSLAQMLVSLFEL